MSSVIHFLIHSTVPRAVSYYDSNYGSLSHTVHMNGYPLAVKNEIFAAVSGRAQEENTPVQIVHHCLDNSVQGVILPAFSTGVYAYDIYDPDERNILADYAPKTIASLLDHLEAARSGYTEARRIHDSQEEIYISQMNFEEANRLTEETVRKLLDGKRTDGSGSSVHRFFGASTAAGSVNYIPEVTAEIPKRYFVKGRPGTGKSTFLKKIAAEAEARGFAVEIYHCSLDPNSLDLVAVRELGFCLFDSTAPHEYFPSRPTDEIIDLYQRCVTPGTDEKYAAELERLNVSYKGLLAEAAEHLKKVKALSDEFEASLPRLEERQIKCAADAVMKKLFL